MAAHDHIELAASDVGDVDRLKPDVREQLEFPEPDRSPFSRIVSLLGKRKVKQMTFTVQEERDPEREVDVVADSDAGTQTVVVEDYTPFIEDQVWTVITDEGRPTGCQLILNATPTTTTLDITPPSGSGRIFGGSDVDIKAGYRLKRLNLVRSESDTAGTPMMRATGRSTQQCQIIEKVLQVSTVMDAADTYGKGERVRINAQGVRDFARDWENTLIFSEQTTDTTTSTETFWTTKGIRRHCIEQNQFDFGGILTYDKFVNFVQQCNRLGGVHEKFLICSNELAAGIANWPLNHDIARQEASRETFGFNIDTIKIPGLAGDVHIVISYDFDGLNEFLLIDPRGLEVADYIPQKIKKNIETPGQEVMKWKMIRHSGLSVARAWGNGIGREVNEVR